jgi:murein DD-endopeptidase MepM/ murein hydrolase activator NlpD
LAYFFLAVTMTKRSKLHIYLGLILVILIALPACQTSEATPFIPPKSTSLPKKPTLTPVVSTPVIKYPTPTANHPETIQLEIPFAEPTAEPLLVSFSSSPDEHDLPWRPPLYPVPLALTPFDHFYFSRPFAVDFFTWPVEDYRYGGSFFEDVVHSGMDIKMDVGTPILAAGPGKVVWSGYGLYSGRYNRDDPYGNAVMIRHNFGFQGLILYTVYAHLDRVDVVNDQYVQSGEFLGLSGTTGKTSGPHLHFEVRLKEGDFFYTLNPELWLVPPQGWGVLAGRVMNTGGRKVEGQMVIVHSTIEERFWRAKSYHRGNSNSDPYYQENLVISDLPAGRYKIAINYLSRIYTREIDIYPGLVSYFSFRGRSGFTNEAPPVPGADFEPSQTP